MLKIDMQITEICKVHPTPTTNFMRRNGLTGYIFDSVEYNAIPTEVQEACFFSAHQFGTVSKEHLGFSSLFVYVSKGIKSVFTVELPENFTELCENRTKALDGVFLYLIANQGSILSQTIQRKILEAIYENVAKGKLTFDVEFIG